MKNCLYLQILRSIGPNLGHNISTFTFNQCFMNWLIGSQSLSAGWPFKLYRGRGAGLPPVPPLQDGDLCVGFSTLRGLQIFIEDLLNTKDGRGSEQIEREPIPYRKSLKRNMCMYIHT